MKKPYELHKLLKNKEVELTIMNTSPAASVYWKEDKFLMTEIELKEYGDIDYIDLEVARRIPKSYFERQWLKIVDFTTEEDIDITLTDIYFYLGILKYYDTDSDGEVILQDIEDYDDIILNSSVKELQVYMSKLSKINLNRFVARCTVLYKQAKLDNRRKIQMIEDFIGREEYFADIKVEN